MRARNIKPGFFINEELGSICPHGRLLFIGLWLLADREGRLEDRPKRIRIGIFPYEVGVDVDALLGVLAKVGLIIRYESDEVKVIAIPGFAKHQIPHRNEINSALPPPPGESNRFNHSRISKQQRNRILSKDGHRCVICGATEDLCIDHILPVAHGGGSEDDNLRALYSLCNGRKGKKLDGEYTSIREVQ